jgi:hypothetical protein
VEHLTGGGSATTQDRVLVSHLAMRDRSFVNCLHAAPVSAAACTAVELHKERRARSLTWWWLTSHGGSTQMRTHQRPCTHGHAAAPQGLGRRGCPVNMNVWTPLAVGYAYIQTATGGRRTKAVETNCWQHHRRHLSSLHGMCLAPCPSLGAASLTGHSPPPVPPSHVGHLQR